MSSSVQDAGEAAVEEGVEVGEQGQSGWRVLGDAGGGLVTGAIGNLPGGVAASYALGTGAGALNSFTGVTGSGGKD